MIGQLINKYMVKDSSTGKEYSYKTLKGAQRKYNEIAGHSTIYQETTCVNEYITVEVK